MSPIGRWCRDNLETVPPRWTPQRTSIYSWRGGPQGWSRSSLMNPAQASFSVAAGTSLMTGNPWSDVKWISCRILRWKLLLHESSDKRGFHCGAPCAVIWNSFFLVLVKRRVIQNTLISTEQTSCSFYYYFILKYSFEVNEVCQMSREESWVSSSLSDVIWLHQAMMRSGFGPHFIAMQQRREQQDRRNVGQTHIRKVNIISTLPGAICPSASF